MSDGVKLGSQAQRPASPDHRKPCTLCGKPRDVLVRCQIDDTGKWHFVCPGSCWQHVSGGKIDGDGATSHEWYRYGGMWKNKHEAVSAKKPKHKKNKSSASNADATVNGDQAEEGGINLWSGDGIKYTKNDKIRWEGRTYVCRKSHQSEEKRTPGRAYQMWKEEKGLVEDSD